MKNLIKYIIPVILFFALAAKTNAQVSIGLSVNIAPPVIPEYEQPVCPADGYIWTPGYWAYGDNGYYWVPGVWTAPPQPGYLWTPGYWAFIDGFYRWHAGYWGLHVGYYGGIDYGCGYYGNGFVGGMWRGNSFSYNTAVMNVNRTVVHNTYINRTVIVNNGNRTSFNGRGGVTRQPNTRERSYMNERHINATSVQRNYQSAAGKDRNQYYSVNRGKPHTTAVNRSVNNNARPAANNNRRITGTANHTTNSHPEQANAAQRNRMNNTARPTTSPSVNRKANNNTAARPKTNTVNKAPARTNNVANHPVQRANTQQRPAANNAPRQNAAPRRAATPKMSTPQTHANVSHAPRANTAKPAARPAQNGHKK